LYSRSSFNSSFLRIYFFKKHFNSIKGVAKYPAQA
jgi:hypothetical protein